jgi:hypothetical protein
LQPVAKISVQTKVGAWGVMEYYKISNSKHQISRCQVSEMIELNTET